MSWGCHYFLPWSKIKKICYCNALQESAVLTWSLSLSLQMESMARTLHIMYFVSITTLLFGILGLFGAIKGKQWALIMVGKPVPVVSTTRVNPQQSDTSCPHTCFCVCCSPQLEWSSSASSWLRVRYRRWFSGHRYNKADALFFFVNRNLHSWT